MGIWIIETPQKTEVEDISTEDWSCADLTCQIVIIVVALTKLAGFREMSLS